MVGAVSLIGATAAEALMETARRGARKTRALSRHARGKILDGAATEVEGRTEEFAQTIASEAGKTIRQARKEVLRAVNTLRLSAAEARRNAGEVIPFDSYEGSEDRTGWYSREPLGIIAAITPFNDPLNLVAHKVGPAIAGGNAVILKPSALTPLSAQLLTDALVGSGLPPEALTIVHGGREVAETIIRARDVRMVSFTGGFSTGESIARRPEEAVHGSWRQRTRHRPGRCRRRECGAVLRLRSVLGRRPELRGGAADPHSRLCTTRSAGASWRQRRGWLLEIP